MHTVAVSDAHILRVADIADGGLRLRCVADLYSQVPPVEPLWWISVHGIYRERCLHGEDDLFAPLSGVVQTEPVSAAHDAQKDEELLHHKYHIPARCFAYAADANDPSGWKLPYRLGDNTPDTKRLPKAIQSLLSNYRGTQVGGIPDEAIPAVMRRLETAARELGKMPDQLTTTANAYKKLAEALAQLPA